jgi:cardiolipin synthase
MLNIPNSLTLLRILAVPLFLNLLVDSLYDAALIVFVVAGCTDAVDGAVARLTDTRTELGAHLDPLADKLLVIGSFIALGILGEIPLRLMIMVIIRDAVILGGFILSAVVVGRSMAMAPSLWGKLTTFLQLLSICLVMLDLAAWLHVSDEVLQGVFIATGFATLISGAGYVLDGLRFYQASQEAGG